MGNLEDKLIEHHLQNDSRFIGKILYLEIQYQ